MGFPRGHSLLGASTCSGMGSSLPGLQVDICSTVDLHGLQGDSLGPSSLTLVSAGLFLSHVLTPPFWLLFHSGFFPLLEYVITEVLPPSLMGSALARGGSILEPAGIGSIGHGG